MVDLTLNPFFLFFSKKSLSKNSFSCIKQTSTWWNLYQVDWYPWAWTRARSSSRLLYNAFSLLIRIFSVLKREKTTKIHFGTTQSQPQMLFSNASKYFGFSLFNFLLFSVSLLHNIKFVSCLFEKWYFDFLNNGNYVWHNLVKQGRMKSIVYWGFKNFFFTFNGINW